MPADAWERYQLAGPIDVFRLEIRKEPVPGCWVLVNRRFVPIEEFEEREAIPGDLTVLHCPGPVVSLSGRMQLGVHPEVRNTGPAPWTTCLASAACNSDCPDHGKRGAGT